MKKMLFAILVCVFGFFSFVPAVRAEGGHADHVIENAQETVRQITPDLEKSTNDFFGDAQDVLPEMMKPSSADYAGAFKVIRKDGYFVETYRKNGNFSFLRDADGEYWLVPLSYGGDKPAGSIKFMEDNGKLTFAGGGRLTDPEYFPFTYERLSESVNRSELIRNEIDEFQVVENLQYRVFYAYLRSGTEEYVIPLDSLLSEAGLIKDTVYAADEFIRKIDKYFDEETDAQKRQEAAAKGEYLYGGGVLTRAEANRLKKAAAAPEAILPAEAKANSRNFMPWIIAALAAAAAGCTVLITRKRTKRDPQG